MTSQQTAGSIFPWTIHRTRRGWPAWWQRFYEAGLILSGRYTFWHAWHDGKHDGSRDEYQRIVCNGGDLTPVLDATIRAVCTDLNVTVTTAEKMGELRRAAWVRYRAGSGV